MTNDTNSQYFSQEGLEKLKRELDECKTKVRQEIAQRLEYAKSLGDLSENSEYQEAKESQMLNESRIAELEATLRQAILVEKNMSTDKVQIGSSVEVENIENKTRATYFVVGANEADPAKFKISNESPLGQAILGHKKGDVVEVVAPKGTIQYTIVEVK